MVGLQFWENGIGSNSRDIALEFSRHNRVLFVEYPPDLFSFFTRKSKPGIRSSGNTNHAKANNLRQLTEKLWILQPHQVLISANWLPVTSLFRSINKNNNARFAREIRRAAAVLGFKDYILFNDNDIFRSFHLKELLKPVLSLYYLRDNLMGVPYWFKHGRYLEPELCSKSDLVIANSIYLTRTALQYNLNSFYVEQGCNLRNFDYSKQTEIPADIKNIPPPVIGFIGALTVLRIDIQLLELLATSRKEWSFVLIGPEGAAFKSSKLHKMKNVYFLGAKDLGELPAYLNAFTVAINPQLINKVTIGNYPRKIDEYLAMGKPVVAMQTEAMETFQDVTYLAKSRTDFIPLIEQALRDSDPEKMQARIRFAHSHSWEKSVEEIYLAMEKVKPGLCSGSGERKITING